MINPHEGKPPSIILGIPGMWKDRSDFLSAVIKNSDFIFAGNVLYHPPSRRGISTEISKPDPRLQRAFQIASGNRIPDEELRAIDLHTMTPYLIGPGGSFENAKFMVQAAAAVLKAGGLGVKVESAGIAHSRARWLELENQELFIYGLDAFVVFCHGTTTYSCGMHNLGFRDAVFPSFVEDSVEMLRLFLRYSITPAKPLSDRNTVTLGQFKYRMHTRPCTTFAADSPFHNPYGVWSLERTLP